MKESRHSVAVPRNMMHLTEVDCRENVLACVKGWLLRSTTAFHEWDDWTLPPYFGLLCWSYAFAGIVMLITEPAWVIQKTTLFPYHFFAWMLIFIQSPLSFLADFIYMDQDSVFHILDRLVAVPLMTLELWKVACLWRYATHVSVTFLYTLSTLSALFCFLQSQKAQSVQDVEGFITWHNRWHMYPLLASVLTLYDFFVLPTKEPTPRQGVSQRPQRLASSTLVMKPSLRFSSSCSSSSFKEA